MQNEPGASHNTTNEKIPKAKSKTNKQTNKTTKEQKQKKNIKGTIKHTTMKSPTDFKII